jgi:hypothetical protein
MSTAKKKVPPQMGLRALKAHAKALEECFGRAKADLREAKKALKERDEQLAHMSNVAASWQADCEALREVLASMRALVRSKRWKALEDMSKEWA